MLCKNKYKTKVRSPKHRKSLGFGYISLFEGRRGAIFGVSWRHLGGGWPSGVRKPGLAWICARTFKVQGLAWCAAGKHENAIRIPFSAFSEFRTLKEFDVRIYFGSHDIAFGSRCGGHENAIRIALSWCRSFKLAFRRR